LGYAGENASLWAVGPSVLVAQPPIMPARTTGFTWNPQSRDPAHAAPAVFLCSPPSRPTAATKWCYGGTRSVASV